MPSPSDRFLTALARSDLGNRACNQYSRTDGDVRENAIRRDNLRLYLQEMSAIGPRVLLVGEAVSHRGGRLTGIAFCSETVMLRGVDIASPPRHILGNAAGYRKATAGETLSTEASATMVWGTIRDIDPLPMLWNAFPFHPFHHEWPQSNRVPSADELAIGSKFIGMLLELFPIERVVAVGNQASISMTKLGIEHAKVRHPSMGGKNAFVEGLRTLLSRPVQRRTG